MSVSSLHTWLPKLVSSSFLASKEFMVIGTLVMAAILFVAGQVINKIRGS